VIPNLTKFAFAFSNKARSDVSEALKNNVLASVPKPHVFFDIENPCEAMVRNPESQFYYFKKDPETAE